MEWDDAPLPIKVLSLVYLILVGIYLSFWLWFLAIAHRSQPNDD